jgi:esterase/lipase superfamily enzyme
MKYFYFILLGSLIIGCGPVRKSNSGRNPDTKSSGTSDTTVIDSVAIVPDTTVKTGVDPEEKNLIKHVKILYGTDRKEQKLSGRFVKYLAASSDLGEACKVGYTIVTIPPDHVPGTTDAPSMWKMEFSRDSTKHMVNKSTVKLTNAEFDSMLKNIKNGSEGFIFVHGYNNSFEDAALRTAQITEDIGLPIVPIMFSWSSNGKFLQYGSDADNVQLAIPAFKKFIKRVYALSHFKKIHLIAHSMGNRLVSKALYEMSDDLDKVKFDQIVMAAPDVYAAEFKRDLAPAMRKRAKRITVYSAKNDWALYSSRLLHSNMRLGQVGLPPYPVSNIDIIDAVNVKTDFLGHGTFSQSEAIMNDINKLFVTGEGPDRRGIPHRKVNNLSYYFFKKWGAQ